MLAVVGGLTLALAHAAQHGGVPTAARQLAAEDTPHATLDAPDTVHADAFFGSQHRGGVQTDRSNPHIVLEESGNAHYPPLYRI